MSSHMVCESGHPMGVFLPPMVCLPPASRGIESAHVRTWCAIVAPKGAFLPPTVCLPPAPRGHEFAHGVQEWHPMGVFLPPMLFLPPAPRGIESAHVAPEGAFLLPIVCLPPAPRGHEFAHGVREWHPMDGVLASRTEGALSPHMGWGRDDHDFSMDGHQPWNRTETITTSNFLLLWGGEGRSWGSLFFRRASPENLSGGDGDVHPPFDPNRDIRDIDISLWSGMEGGTGWGRVVLPSESLVGDSPESRRSTTGNLTGGGGGAPVTGARSRALP
ncbi:hypothetical protein GQ457_12G013410 [Hibiscus cannabinus]